MLGELKMQEQVITIANSDTKEIVGLLFVEEIDCCYIKRKIVAYIEHSIKNDIIAIVESFNELNVNIPTLCKKLTEGLNNGSEPCNYTVLEPFVLESNNNNKSSRNKRALKELGVVDNLERCVFYGGTQDY